MNPFFLGTSAAIRTLEAETRQISASDSPIYIHGETGTGKGLLARYIHEHGPRARRAFVDLNCATLGRELLESELFGHERGAFTGAVENKPGLLEIADRATAFLDEVGDLDPSVQPKMLKVLEERRYRRLGDVVDRPVDVRFITATHQDLDELVEQGLFRRDLYYRICILPLRVPSLRERREDIPEIARYLVGRIAKDLGRGEVTLSEDAVAFLQEHSWPGNVRELRNAIERALLACDSEVLERRHFAFLAARAPRPSRASSGDKRSMTLTEAERTCILEGLKEAEGRVDLAAMRLGISRSSLYNKIKKHGLGRAAVS